MMKLILLIALLGLASSDLIDKAAKLSPYPEKDWYVENIPFIEIPDHNIEEVYYYRWSTHKRHLRYLNPGTGYVVTEFVLDVSWQPKLGGLVDAAGHQIYESRWIKNPRYAEDYINFFARVQDKGGNHQYSEWVADAAYNTYLVTGNKDFITSQLEGLVKNYNEWSDHWEPTLGLYYISPLWDAQEYSAASVQTNDKFAGGVGYRPSHNSEMYANALAISKIAKLAGDTKVADDFTKNANNLRDNIIKRLWDNTRNFFYHVQRDNNPSHALLDTREEIGFYPWRYNIPDDKHNYSLAFDELFDAKGFNTAFGPSTCETRSKWYDGEQTAGTCCWWNGNSWPYSTAHTLRALAVHLRDYSKQNPKITVDNYIALLKKYALTQYKNNKPYVAETHSPVHDFWVGDGRNHSEHYAHSTYVDNVLVELIGVIPQEDNTLVVDPLIPANWTYFAAENINYRGHTISIVYDKTGDKYKQGKGLSVLVDGKVSAQRDDLGSLTVKGLDTKTIPKVKRLENYAANPYNPNEPKTSPYPKATSSYAGTRPDSPNQANDGRIFYDSTPSNRWSNTGSTKDTDWFGIDFLRPKTFDSVDLYVYSDVATNGKIDCPTKMVVQYITAAGEWMDAEKQVAVPAKCAPNQVNRISFTAVKTSQLRVQLTRNVSANHFVGLTEFEAWGEYPQTTGANTFEIEDGRIVDAAMAVSDTASDRGYVGSLDKSDSYVELSGVTVAKSGDYKVRVFYANADSASTQNVFVNNLHNVEIKYPTTSEGKAHFSEKTYVEVTLPLQRGGNVLKFSHKTGYAELDKLEIVV